jgi:hypothetical protein
VSALAKNEKGGIVFFKEVNGSSIFSLRFKP